MYQRLDAAPKRQTIAGRIAAGILLLLCMDGLAFRSGWYSQWLEPNSSAGQVEGYLYWLQREPRSPVREVIVMGDSRIGHAFSTRTAGVATGGSIRFWNFGIVGTLPRDWYYILRDADPDRRRFAAIVLALDQYSDEDYDQVFADRTIDLNFLAARLRIADCPEFVFSMQSTQAREFALGGCVLKGFALSSDVRDFLRDVPGRVKRARDWREHGLAFVNQFEGIDRDVRGLSADWERRTIHFPPGLDEAARLSIQATLMPHWPPHSGATTRYRQKWLTKIFDRYSGSDTRIVLLELPRAPLAKPESATPRTFLASALPREGVEALDSSTFRDLESPEYFFDGLHLNRKGRAIFSARLGAVMRERFRQSQ